MRDGPCSETPDRAGSREQPPDVWVQRGTGLLCAQCHPKGVAQSPAFIGGRWDAYEALQLLKKRLHKKKSRRGWEKGLKFKCSLVSETFTVPVEMETGKEGATCSMNNQTRALVLL